MRYPVLPAVGALEKLPELARDPSRLLVRESDVVEDRILHGERRLGVCAAARGTFVRAFTFRAFQVLPPSVVSVTVDLSPTANPWLSSMKKIEKR